MTFALAAALVGVLQFISLDGPVTPTVRAAGAPPTSVADLRERIAAILQDEGVAGAGVAIVTRDQVLLADGIGLADVAQRRLATADTPFRLGSVTKNMTALAVMQQVEQGRLSLSSRVRDIAPEVPFDNPWETDDPVRVVNLLEHTAGFDIYRFNDDVDYGPAAPRPVLAALEVNPAAKESRWPPGSRIAYSNEGYTVAGYLLEKVTGQSFDEVVDQNVFQPLGMHSSALRLTPSAAATLAIGYDSSGVEQPYLEDMQRPAANLLASANDMAAYVRMLLNGGELNGQRVVSTATLRRMEVRQSTPYAAPAAQYGLGTETSQYSGFVTHGHAGITYGFTASMQYLPDEGVGWVVMLNQLPGDQAMSAIEAEIVAFLMQGRQPAIPAVAPPDSDLTQFVGFYRNAAPRDAFSAAVEDVFGGSDVELRVDGLWQRTREIGGLRALVDQPAWHHLVPVGGRAFRLDDESVSSQLFTSTDDGRQVLVTDLGYFEKTPQLIATAKRVLVLGALAVACTPVVAITIVWLLMLAGYLNVSSKPWAAVDLGSWWYGAAALLLSLIPASSWLVLNRGLQRLDIVNATTVVVFLLSSALPLVALATVLSAVRCIFANETGLIMKLYLNLVAVSGIVLTIFAWAARWIALRTWVF